MAYSQATILIGGIMHIPILITPFWIIDKRYSKTYQKALELKEKEKEEEKKKAAIQKEKELALKESNTKETGDGTEDKVQIIIDSNRSEDD